MIFLSLGTHEQPFERALDLVLPLAPSTEVVIQSGHTPQRDGTENVVWHSFMPYETMTEMTAAASDVVCHAGVGTIITSIRLGKTPVVVPRLHALGEHVDDHQLQITTELHASGAVIACMPGDDLEERMAEARARPRAPAVSRSTALRNAVAAAAAGSPGDRARGGRVAIRMPFRGARRVRS